MYRSVFVVAAAVLVWATPARAEQRYALVIGANPGWSQDRPLRYAENDAERVRDVLVSLGGFAPDRVDLIRDPDTADVRAALRRLSRIAATSTDEVLVFVYYSGHADDEHLHLRGDPLTHKELHATLRKLPARVKVGVVDACKSGALTRKGGGPASEFTVDLAAPDVRGLVIITSSGADELSQESRALAGSVFTHHLVSAMRGAGDADSDGSVTISEAYHHAFTRTRADTTAGPVPQRPAFRYELSGQGELVLTRLAAITTGAAAPAPPAKPAGSPPPPRVRSGNARVTVPRAAGNARYVVLDHNEWRLVAETRADPDRDVTLVLPAGTYRIKRVYSDRLEVGSVSLQAGGSADANRVAYVSAPLSGGIVKGDPAMLAPEEHREYRRAQAFGLLADGQAAAALGIFDQLLRESPDDALSWRGRGRALVRMAEAYQRVNDKTNERRALNDALTADPSLSEDPLFQIWYKRLGELESRERSTAAQQQQLDQSIRKNPRTTKRLGLGFDLISGRGAMAVTATAVVKRMFFPRIAVDLAGPGLDAGVVVAPFPSRWSPFVGIGGHVSFETLGIDLGSDGMVTVNEESYSYDEMYGRTFRVEAGAQFVGRSGFTTELGLTMLMFETERMGEKKLVQQMMPVLHFGWLF